MSLPLLSTSPPAIAPSPLQPYLTSPLYAISPFALFHFHTGRRAEEGGVGRWVSINTDAEGEKWEFWGAEDGESRLPERGSVADADGQE